MSTHPSLPVMFTRFFIVHPLPVSGPRGVRKARAMAARAHYGQTRKYTGEPYITHPRRVATMLEEHGCDADMVAAAWLHDVVEDTDLTMADIREFDQVYGMHVSPLVAELTHVEWPDPMPPRAHRKAVEVARLAHSLPRTHTIKCADLIDNSDIIEHDPKFAKVFVPEMEVLVKHALVYADPVIRAKALQIVGEWRASQ